MQGAEAEQEIIKAHGGDDHTEDTNADADALGLEVVVKQRGSIERMLIVLQLVVLLEVVDHFLIVFGKGVGIREDVTHVVDGIVNPVGLNAVVCLDALSDVVVHLGHHRLPVGHGVIGNDEQDTDKACKNDQFTHATMEKLMDKRFLGSVISSVSQFHNYRFLM